MSIIEEHAAISKHLQIRTLSSMVGVDVVYKAQDTYIFLENVQIYAGHISFDVVLKFLKNKLKQQQELLCPLNVCAEIDSLRKKEETK